MAAVAASQMEERERREHGERRRERTAEEARRFNQAVDARARELWAEAVGRAREGVDGRAAVGDVVGAVVNEVARVDVNDRVEGGAEAPITGAPMQNEPNAVNLVREGASEAAGASVTPTRTPFSSSTLSATPSTPIASSSRPSTSLAGIPSTPAAETSSVSTPIVASVDPVHCGLEQTRIGM